MADFFDPTIARIKDEMRLSLSEQATINQNIANANNPDYVAKSFDKVFQRAIDRQKAQVVLEDELKALGANSMHYSTLTRLYNLKMGVVKTIASQGRR